MRKHNLQEGIMENYETIKIEAKYIKKDDKFEGERVAYSAPSVWDSKVQFFQTGTYNIPHYRYFEEIVEVERPQRLRKVTLELSDDELTTIQGMARVTNPETFWHYALNKLIDAARNSW